MAGEVWLLRNKLHPETNAEEGASIRAVRRVYAEKAGIPLEGPAQLKTFLEGEKRTITVPGSKKKVQYDPLQRIGVGMSRLGTSEAVAIGAYAFAVRKLDGR